MAGVNLGTANMPGQWVGTRSSYTWYLASHPAMAGLISRPRRLPQWYMINAYGAANACPHYAGTITPQFNVAMQRAMLGYHDWATEPKLPKFADWYLNLVTPAEVRFNGKRSVIVDGDGEPDQLPSLFGEMATACAADAPSVSARLMWMWKNNGKPHNSFYGAAGAAHRRGRCRPEDPQLGNAAFPGYYAVLRSGWNTPKETSVHAIIGSWYDDHRTGNSGSVDHLRARRAAVAGLGGHVRGARQFLVPAQHGDPGGEAGHRMDEICRAWGPRRSLAVAHSAAGSVRFFPQSGYVQSAAPQEAIRLDPPAWPRSTRIPTTR